MAETERPHARDVHSVLAAAMADPVLLERWRREPSSIAASGNGASAIDLTKVWRFSGLVTKVRYSDLRSNLPVTFRMLDAAGVSIELFAAYAPTAAGLRKAGLNSKSAKLDAFMNFLDGWLDRTSPVHTLLWDMIRHESAIFHVQTSAAGRSDAPPSAISAGSVPVRRAGAVVHELTCNPVEAARIVRAGGAPASVPQEDHKFCYCASQDGAQIQIIEIDALAGFLLDSADGSTTVSEIAGLLLQCGITLEPEDLVDSIGTLVTAGLLEIVDRGA